MILHNRTQTSNGLIGISLHNENPIKQIEAMKPVYKRFGHNLMKGNQEPNKLKSKESKKVSFGKIRKYTPNIHARVWTMRMTHAPPTRPCMDRVQKNKKRKQDTRPTYTPVYGPCV